MDGIVVSDGLVIGRLVGLASDEMRAAQAADAAARAADERLPAHTRAHAQRQVEIFSGPPDLGGDFHQGAWDECVVGEPPAWPRAERARRLAATDYVEFPGWRAGKDEALLADADAYRQALRDLTETQPDALAVVWPANPLET